MLTLLTWGFHSPGTWEFRMVRCWLHLFTCVCKHLPVGFFTCVSVYPFTCVCKRSVDSPVPGQCYYWLSYFPSPDWLPGVQVTVYLMQIIFGVVDFPAKLFALGMLSYLGRRVSQAACLFLSALIIFANIFVPTGDNNQTCSNREIHR